MYLIYKKKKKHPSFLFFCIFFFFILLIFWTYKFLNEFAIEIALRAIDFSQLLNFWRSDAITAQSSRLVKPWEAKSFKDIDPIACQPKLSSSNLLDNFISYWFIQLLSYTSIFNNSFCFLQTNSLSVDSFLAGRI